MPETLTLRTARQRVRDYQSESDDLVARRPEAIEGRDVEALLQLGIDAFRWLIRADAEIRAAVFSGALPHDEAREAALGALCKAWLAPCEFAERWVAAEVQRGRAVDNLAEFRKCREEMQAIVAFQEGGSDELPPALAELGDRAATEHRHGETAEFV